MTQWQKLFVVLFAPFRGEGGLADDRGQTLAEYALILALIALLVVGAVVFLQGQISSLFSDIGSHL